MGEKNWKGWRLEKNKLKNDEVTEQLQRGRVEYVKNTRFLP